MIQATTTLNKISKLIKDNPDAHVYSIVGGACCSKTFSILILLINHCLNKPDSEINIVSHQLSKARITVIKDFRYIMSDFGIYNPDKFRGGVEYTFENGSMIRFIGADRMDIGKGLRTRGWVFFNEANRLAYETYRQISSRAEKVILDYNADFESYIERRVNVLPDTAFLRVNVYDNEMAPENEVKEIESYKEQGYNSDGTIKDEYFANLYNVYGLGMVGRSIGAVFTNWTVGEFVDTGATCFGLDFGYSSDPDALVLVSLDDHHKTIYLKEYMYQNGNSTDDLTQLLKDKCGSRTIVADCAEDRLIHDLYSRGLNIKACRKNGIVENIKVVRGYRIIVDEDSYNLQNELNKYVWVDKQNKSIPIDKHNHLLDAGLRYAFNFLHGNELVPDEIMIL